MFNERLKTLRKEKGLTQKQIADHFNTSPQSYAQWEKGTRTPSQKSLEKLSDFFDVSVDYLLGRTENQSNITNTGNNSIVFQENTGSINYTHTESSENKRHTVYEKNLIKLLENTIKKQEELLTILSHQQNILESQQKLIEKYYREK